MPENSETNDPNEASDPQQEIAALRREVARLEALNTARVGAEEALARSELFSQALLRSLPAHVAVLDREGVIVGVNSAWERIARETGETTLVRAGIGADYAAACRAAGEGDEDARRCAEGLEAVLRGSAPGFDLVYPHDGPAGRRWWLLRAVPISHASGGLVVAHFDVTSQRVSEEALKRSLENFRILFTHHPHPLWVYDAETFRFLEVNEAAVARYGWSREEFLARTVHDIRVPEDQPRLQSYLEAPEGQIRLSGEWKHRLKSGETIEVDIRAHLLEFAGRAAVLVMAEDVTERKRSQQQQLQSQKMDIVGRLASGLAHDFNNSLTAILGFAGLAELEMPLGHPANRHIQGIQEASAGATRLLKQLLAFARRQNIEPQVVDVNGLVVDVDHLLRHLVGEHIQIVTVPKPRLWAVRVDPDQLKQVLINIADFMRDRMPGGGRVELETENVTLDADYARQHVAVVPGEYVRLTISDNGPGLSEELKAHIFEPFFTPSEYGADLGLGMATVYGIVKQSGGYVWVYSEPGRGTTFKIYLPRVQDAATEAVRTASQGVPRGSETVLVVDDEPLVRSIAIQGLRTLGYTVIEASNGPEALRLARGHAGRIDLLLTDTVMPLMSGPELARRMAEVKPDTRVLFTSGYTQRMLEDQGNFVEGAAFIAKPFSHADLARKVRDVLDEAKDEG